MTTLVIAAVLAIAFLGIGLSKLSGVGVAAESVTRLGYSRSFARMVGLAEVVAAALLGWGVRDGRGTIAGCALIIVLMIGALHGHIVRSRDPFAKWAPAATFLIMAVVLLGMTL